METGRGNYGMGAGAWLVREWAGRLAQSLESMGGGRPEVKWQPAPPGSGLALQSAALAARHGAALWWEQSFDASEARFWVGAPEAAWSAMGARILSAAGIDQAETADARATWLELLGQSLDGLASSIGTQLRREVVCPERTEQAGPPAAGEFFIVGVEIDGAPLPPLLAAPSEALANLVAAVPQADDAPRTAMAPAADAGAAPCNRMLDLLLDVELPVCISFGHTHLPLKEALKLTTGSIVALNRAVAEPVEVVVNNCVIARGEVVVIEGNYGVRIREIMSRRDRLRNLR
jgi:flagellar motor switch protein FliN